MLNALKQTITDNLKRKIYDYSEYDCLPKHLKETVRNPWEHMDTGIALLELLDKRFITNRNLKVLKHILENYFFIEITKLEHIRIYVGEYTTVYMWFSRFKIHVLIDCD